MWPYCLLRMVCAFLLSVLPISVLAMSVTFINPGKSDEIYWVTATNSMAAAADNLNVKLEVLYAERDHLRALDFARQLAARSAQNKPDYVIVSNDYGTGAEVIRILDAAHIKTFLAFSNILNPEERQRILGPRQIFKGWLGSLEPKAEEAGYLTARALIERGEMANMRSSDGKLHLLVIAGDRSTPTSLKRNEGMRRAVAEARNVLVDQEVYGEWSREKAREQSTWLYKRYPQAKLIWAGNDLMAFGAMESWAASGGKPGQDAFFSGINTSAEALQALISGRMTGLAGGHFIAGAFALVMLHDYHHGKDFQDEGLELERPMFILFSTQEAQRFQSQFSDLNFHKINFRKFSKVLNPAVKKYEFSFRQLLQQTEGRK
ncbi:ABC transporter substrate-binding protein [Undibacterium sp. SXout7W]|uniref:ABC transporter substrate-binding protein n=1 Tax=Undibacterium sp. SXout7W TaxID=3413049 RepID=UPI003BF0986A